MAIKKLALWDEVQFKNRVAKYAKHALASHLQLWDIAKQLVFRLYSSADTGQPMAEYALNTLPEFDRKALARYLNRCGITVTPPAPGLKTYVVGKGCVRDRKYQEQAFDYARTTPIIVSEQREGKQQNAKVLTGTAHERAIAAVTKAVSRMKKTDELGAAELNDMLQLLSATSMLIDTSGNRFKLDAGELAALLAAHEQYTEDSFVSIPTLKAA